MVAWLVIGGMATLVQSWWAYQLMLFLVPLGILATIGIDELAQALEGKSRALTAAVVGVLVLATARPAFLSAQRSLRLVQNDLALTVAGREGFRSAYMAEYRLADQSVAFVRAPDAADGDIYVFGNPIYLMRSGRDQAIPMHGWSPEFNDERAWEEIRTDLAAEMPRYVLIDDFSMEIISERSPETLSFLESRYDLLRRDPGDVTWYEARR
jgi:hypothetical protein